MNIDSHRSSRSSYEEARYLSTGYPNGAVSLVPSHGLVDGYRSASDVTTDDRSQYSGSGAIPQTNAPSIDMADSVLLHLLTETAIGDSAAYEILPFEEVEELKREYAILSNQVEGTKRKLALETKLRDAAQSLRRLSSLKSNGDSGYTNGVTNGNTNGIHHPEDEEFALSSRKCEELAQELWALERRAQDIYKRFLEHTAGILQLTHRGLKKSANRDIINNDSNGGGFDFDERSLYRALELEDAGLPAQNGAGGLTADVDALRSTEQKIEELNGRLRDLLLQSHDAHDIGPLPLRVSEDTSLVFVQNHLAYLERSLETLQTEGVRGGAEPELSASEMGTELSDINNRLQNLLGLAGSHLSPTLPPPPSASGEYLSNHMDYLKSGMKDLQNRVAGLQDQKSILTTQIQQQRELNSKSDAEKDAHVADLAQQLVETRKQYELSEREVEAIREESAFVTEQLAEAQRQHELSEREVEAARDELALLMEQLDSVKQQENIQGQQKERDQGVALENEKDARLKAESEIERLQDELNGERDARVSAETEFERLQNELNSHKDAQLNTDAEFEHLQNEITSEKDARLSAETELERLQNELNSHMDARLNTDAEFERLQNELNGEKGARSNAEAKVEHLQNELNNLETEFARAQTELTVVKAELDGAYGTRAERAAEAAASPALYREIEDLNTKNISLAEELAALRAEKVNNNNNAAVNNQGDLQRRVETLQKELEETIEDYEAMTKASIEFEKDREKYDGLIDSLRDRCEQLEAQLSDERITWMGVNSQTAMRDGATETTSTMVLKNEFKKMMRDTRSENLKLLRAEQEERKKLEALVRSLKMEQTMNKSNNINQSMVT